MPRGYAGWADSDGLACVDALAKPFRAVGRHLEKFQPDFLQDGIDLGAPHHAPQRLDHLIFVGTEANRQDFGEFDFAAHDLEADARNREVLAGCGVRFGCVS